MPRRVSSPIFVGRVAERAALTEALERAATGRPGVVLISGEAGVGKTRLLAEAAKIADGTGATTVAGVCVDVAAGTLSYAPFVDIVRDLHRAGLTASLPKATRAELGRLVHEIESRAEAVPVTEEGGQGRLFAAIRDAVSAASSSKPILVTIEDLHWADASTLDLVRYLARSMQEERYLLLMTARTDTLPRRHPLLAVLADLGRLPWLERIDLARFDEPEVAQQLTGILGRVPDPELTREVFGRSDGNAFFAEELVATGAVRGGPLPSSLRDVMSARLAALDDPTQRVLQVAAVAGRTIGHELLERVAGVESAVLLAALREAVEQRLLVQVDDPVAGYGFRHALVREAAYDDLLPAERVSIHGAIADALEREPGLTPGGELAFSGEIAHHAMAAHDVSRALTASLAAVTVAERAYAFAEAEVHLDRILEIWPQVPDATRRVGMDHPELLARAARVAAFAGHQTHGVKLALEALAELDPADVETRVAILLELFDYAWEGADIGTAERAVREVMSMVDGDRSARSAQAFAAHALLSWHHGRYSSAREAALRAIDIARERGARRELARALNVLGQVYTHLGETNNARHVLTEAGQIFEDVSFPVGEARALRWQGWAAFMHGAFEESLDLDQRALEIARREGTDARQGLVLLDGILENLVELGRWSEAEATADQIMARMTTSFEMVYSHASLARMYTLMGRFAEAEHEVAQAAEIWAVGPHRVWQVEDAVLLAYTTGRHADGRELVESAIAAVPEPDRDATLWWLLVKAIAGEADRAEAARSRRRAAEADEAVGFGRRFASLLRTSAANAIAADGGGPMVMAELLNADAEESRLEGRSDPLRWVAVVEARSQLEKPWELAYAQFRYAEAILGNGGAPADAAEPLRQAHAGASSLGAEPLRAAIEALASRARVRLQSDPASVGQDGDRPATTLTARELEVLTLVAAGHTNREIGDRLFISEKTASVHVTHAMDKLGALSRYEAAATATRLGLLEPAEAPATSSAGDTARA